MENERQHLLARFLDEGADASAPVGSPSSAAVTPRSATRSGPARGWARVLAAAAFAASATLMPALLALPSSSASAATTKYCSAPRFIDKSHTRYCPNGISHWTHNYTRSSTYLSGGYWHTCYHFQSYAWYIGCQTVSGPYDKKRCN